MNVFDKSDENLIAILANQTANALQNARLYQLEQKRLKELNDAHQELENLNSNLEKKVEERTSELEKLSKKDILLVDLDKGEPEVMVKQTLENMGYKLDIVKSDKDWIRFKVMYELN